MNKVLACRKYIKFIAPVFFLISVIGYTACVAYSQKNWNASQFETFYARGDFMVAYLIEAITITLFLLIYLICSKIRGNKFRDLLSFLSFSLLCASCCAVIITICANCIGLKKVMKDYKLDCQLESEKEALFREAIDALIPQLTAGYFLSEPNEFVLKAARDGYPRAQNAIGCFYHERAVSCLSKSDYENNETRRRNLLLKSEQDFEHAIYWFIKAAQNDFGISQTNLGRIFMGNLASNRIPDKTLAKRWLIKATQNGHTDAYYFLGIIYSEENLRDAYIYWSKGAEAGNEQCAKELEKPEFAFGMPQDSPVTELTTNSNTTFSE